jgi:hypothetical protein
MGFLKDRTILVLIGILLVLILIAVGLYVFSEKAVNPIMSDQLQNDLVSMPNSDAVRIALNDPEVQGYLANHTYSSDNSVYNTFTIENASGFANMYNISGYVNSPPDEYRRIAIRITGTRSYFDALDLLLTVDMTEKKVVGISPRHWIAWPPEGYAVVPRGAYWYHQFSGYGLGQIDVQPNNSIVYIAVFTEDNFYRFMNGTSYIASIFDRNTSQWVNTTAPFTGVSSNGSLPPDAWLSPTITNNYLVVKNGEKDTGITISGVY